jgi:hypothetical protein
VEREKKISVKICYQSVAKAVGIIRPGRFFEDTNLITKEIEGLRCSQFNKNSRIYCLVKRKYSRPIKMLITAEKMQSDCLLIFVYHRFIKMSNAASGTNINSD